MTIDEISEILREYPENFPQALTEYLDGGGDINARDQSGFPLLVRAAGNRNLEAVTLLLDKHANINHTYHPDGWTALHYAVINKVTPLLYFLLKHEELNVDLSAKTSIGVPLHCAAIADNTEYIEALLDRGAEINLLTSYNATPLMAAANEDRWEAVKVLIKRGANIEGLLKSTWHANKHEFIYSLLSEYGHMIPEPLTPYEPMVAKRVAEHNAKIINSIEEMHKALSKAKIIKDVANVIEGYLYSNKQQPKTIKRKSDPLIVNNSGTKLRTDQKSAPQKSHNLFQILWAKVRKFINFVKNQFLKIKNAILPIKSNIKNTKQNHSSLKKPPSTLEALQSKTLESTPSKNKSVTKDSAEKRLRPPF